MARSIETRIAKALKGRKHIERIETLLDTAFDSIDGGMTPENLRVAHDSDPLLLVPAAIMAFVDAINDNSGKLTQDIYDKYIGKESDLLAVAIEGLQSTSYLAE